MRGRTSLTAISLLVLLSAAAFAPCVFAQDGIFVTPIPNNPFSAVVTLERSVVRPDGSVINFKSIHEIGRDSLGRIHNEARTFVPDSSSETPQVKLIHLYDPQTRISTMINPNSKTFWTQTVNRPPATLPPTLLEATPSGSSLPQNEFAGQQDLGTRQIEGAPAHGIRTTQSVADKDGKTVEIADEYWYSEDLRINVVVKHSDPRTGGVTFIVTQVKRADPAPSFFEAPEGFTQSRGPRAVAR